MNKKKYLLINLIVIIFLIFVSIIYGKDDSITTSIISCSSIPPQQNIETYVFVTKWGSTGTGDGQFGRGPLSWYKITDNTIEDLKNEITDEKKIEALKSLKDKEYNDDQELASILDNNYHFTDYEIWLVWNKSGIDKPGGKYTYGPIDIAVDKSGSIYVPDIYNNRIQKFDSNGKFITKWGNDEFNRLGNKITVDSEEYVYVSDFYSSNFIKKFDSNGKFITKWGNDEDKNIQFKSIAGITVDPEGYVYVVDYCNRCIPKFESNGKFVKKWLELIRNKKNFDDTSGFDGNIATDSWGNVFVIFWKRVLIVTDDPSNTVSPWITIAYLEDDLNKTAPNKLNNLKYVTQYKFTKEELFTKLKNLNFNEDEIEIIMKHTATCFGPGIVKFDSSGNFIKELDIRGIDLTIDSKENIFIVAKSNHCIQKFDSNGNFITKFGKEGSDNGEFLYPEAVSVDQEGNVYIMDTGNRRVQKFAPAP